MSVLKIAIPNKGRMSELSINLLEQAGIKIKQKSNRLLFADTIIDNIKILFVRAIDIPYYISSGSADLGITGYDLILERRADVGFLLDLKLAKAELVVAVPKSSNIEDLSNIKNHCIKIATSFTTIARKYIRKKRINAKIINISGAVELTPKIGISDAIIDLSSSGTTIRENDLVIIDKILTTTMRFIVNKDSYIKNKDFCDRITMALKSVLDAKNKLKITAVIIDKTDKEIDEYFKHVDEKLYLYTCKNGNIELIIDEYDSFLFVEKLKCFKAKSIVVIAISRYLK
ncbi:MAG: ATP phosphoribosyltransferase [DPANN group archaeon]|nr:ATP phosphoribosyltransferase [DPANN group archaeon]